MKCDVPLIMNYKNAKRRFIRLLGLLSTVLLLTAILAGCYRSYSDEEQSYTDKLWYENYGNYQAIYNLPFNRGVADGTLAASKFRNYIIQDYFYLQNYKKAFETLLPKAPDERGRQFIVAEIQGIDEEIKTVHMTYFKKYNITNEEILNSVPNPTTEEYNSYLIKTATGEPFQVGLIATLPCNWIYFRVATDMKKKEQVESNPYQEWIDAYGSTPWDDSDTKEFVDLIEYYMENADEQIRVKMKQAFNTAFGYEYLFWDTVYK